MRGLYCNTFLDEEVVMESKVYTNKEDNICISTDGDGITYRGFALDPYFKIYNNINPMKATKVTRISMLRPEYIIHNNQRWDMNSREKKQLLKYLNTQIVYEGNNTTVWELIKYLSQRESNSNNNDPKVIKAIRDIILLDMPDYTKL